MCADMGDRSTRIQWPLGSAGITVGSAGISGGDASVLTWTLGLLRRRDPSRPYQGCTSRRAWRYAFARAWCGNAALHRGSQRGLALRSGGTRRGGALGGR